MTTFLLATAAIILATAGLMVESVRRSRDTFHPAVALGAMVLFLYAFMPLRIFLQDGFFGYLTEGQLGFAQAVNAAGVLALLAGLAAGGRGGALRPGTVTLLPRGKRVFHAALVIGLAGIGGFAAGIVSSGGIAGAYGTAYGGGWSDSGYVRELYLMTAPAILLILASGQLAESPQRWAWVAAFAAPLLMQGLLGARRGPTFVVLVTLLAGRYLIRGLRPRLYQVLAGGAALGLLLLLLVANRSNIYVGSEFKLEGSPTDYLDAGSGNEFIYGAGSVVAANDTGRFFWGGRYATVLFIRPIPRAVWPQKYEFAKQIFGADVEVNMGVDLDALTHTVGWVGAYGAATGIVADMWIEFSWGMLLVMFGLGFFYGRTWRNSVMQGGFWLVVYGVALSLSIYLVMQTMEAFLFRLLFMLAPVVWAWWYARAGAPVRALPPEPPPAEALEGA